MKKVSIIVLVYEVEEYLRKCLNSIVKQTYENIEIILSVSHGKDKSEIICDEYAAEDERIIVVRSQPIGRAGARNLGMEQASGDYIAWVDGDDWIESTMIENLMATAEKERADITICGKYEEYSNRTKIVSCGQERKINKSDYYKDLLLMRNVGVEIWDKLFIANIAKSTVFIDRGEAEDRFWYGNVSDKADTFAYTGTEEYHYRVRKDSGSRGKNVARISFQSDQEMCEKILDYDSDLKPYVDYFLFIANYAALYTDILLKKFSYKQNMGDYKRLKRYASTIIKNRNIRKEDKFKAGLTRISFHMVVWFMRYRIWILSKKVQY